MNFWNFNETLANDVGSFEQPGPVLLVLRQTVIFLNFLDSLDD